MCINMQFKKKTLFNLNVTVLHVHFACGFIIICHVFLSFSNTCVLKLSNLSTKDSSKIIYMYFKFVICISFIHICTLNNINYEVEWSDGVL